MLSLLKNPFKLECLRIGIPVFYFKSNDMAEIVAYKGQPLSLGTDMNLWHVSYTKLFRAYTSGLLKQRSSANLSPEQYLAPDSVFRFRFPFPDEKDLPLTSAVDFRRTVPVSITDKAGESQTVYISQQRCISRESEKSAYLATLYRDATGMIITEITDQIDAEDFTRQIVLNHIFKEPDSHKQNFYRHLVSAIINGYHQSISLPE